MILGDLIEGIVLHLFDGTSPFPGKTLQKNIVNEMAGRVFGAAGTIGDISIPIAMLTYGFLLRRVSCSWLMATTGVFLILLSGLFYRSYRRIDVPEKGHLVVDQEFYEQVWEAS